VKWIVRSDAFDSCAEMSVETNPRSGHSGVTTFRSLRGKCARSRGVSA
jgi:hypothetical protein